MAYQNIKFNEICRLCLVGKHGMKSVFDNLIPMRIMSLTNLQVFEGDGLPVLICDECCGEIDNLHKFQTRCQQSDNTLRQLLKAFLLETEDVHTETCDVKLEILEDDDPSLQSLLDFQSDLSVEEPSGIDRVNKDLLCAAIIPANTTKNSHTKRKKPLNKNDNTEKKLTNPSRKLSKPPFICEICSKIFSSRHNLRKHELIHTGIKPFLCDECGKSFVRKEDLTVHTRYHTGIRPYSCRWCDRTFVIQSGLKSHESRHTKVKPFLCNWCGKTFSNSGQLRIHERQHTNERPYSCSLCSGTFTSRQAWTNHMKRHTGIEYVCDICQRPFYTTSGLDRHKLLHAGYKAYPCDFCELTFFTKSEVTRHIRYHKNERRYQCGVCGKSFVEKQHLSVHERIHTGERPYACQLCSKAFYSRSKLSRHMLVHKPKYSGSQDIEEETVEEEIDNNYECGDSNILEGLKENEDQTVIIGENVKLNES